MAGFFAGKVAKARAGQLGQLIGRWEPELVVRDEVDFGAALAAEAAGLPHAAVAVIAAGRLTRPEVIETSLAEVRAELGLDPEGAVQALHRYLLLVPVPGSFRDPTVPLPDTARCVRPAALEHLPRAAGPGRTRTAPHVYVTLGTIFPQESGDLFQRALAGLAALPVEVTVTIGDAITPAELGDLPATVRVEPFLPLVEILPTCDLVVSHGGSGTVIASLALAVPQLVLAMGADQPDNADRCRDLNVGLALDPLSASPADIAEAATTVLRDPGYRSAAAHMADEARSLPGSEHAADLLEAIAEQAPPTHNDSLGRLGRAPERRK